jgi:ribosomal-protein-alanine N-acetyltransferase
VSGVFVSRADDADVADVERLQASCHSHPWTRAQVAAEVRQPPPSAVLVARGADLRTRAALAYRVAADEVEILDVCVHPDCRRTGLARRLVLLALSRAARAGARRAHLEVRAGNAAARALYASIGFVERGLRRGYYRGPIEDALLLEYRISDR